MTPAGTSPISWSRMTVVFKHRGSAGTAAAFGLPDVPVEIHHELLDHVWHMSRILQPALHSQIPSVRRLQKATISRHLSCCHTSGTCGGPPKLMMLRLAVESQVLSLPLQTTACCLGGLPDRLIEMRASSQRACTSAHRLCRFLVDLETALQHHFSKVAKDEQLQTLAATALAHKHTP